LAPLKFDIRALTLNVRWNLNGLEFCALTLYASASPAGILLENQLHVPNAFLLSLLNLPFLALLGPLMMALEQLHPNQVVGLGFMWAIVFVQSYVAFLFLRWRAESNGVETWRALKSSFRRITVIALATSVLGGLALVLALFA